MDDNLLIVYYLKPKMYNEGCHTNSLDILDRSAYDKFIYLKAMGFINGLYAIKVWLLMNKNKDLKCKDCKHNWDKLNSIIFCRSCGTFLTNLKVKGFTNFEKNLVEVELI